VCVMNGPKGPSCVWSKAPIWCKKYPAVAGYLMKMEQSSTKGPRKDVPYP
jgi:nitrous oxide reductase accessory protein NosL